MPRLIPCPYCKSHVRVGEARCPHCDRAFGASKPGLAVAAFGLGLAVASCDKDGAPTTPPTTSDSGGDVPIAEPEYGVPMTGDEPADPPPTDTSDTADSEGRGDETERTVSPNPGYEPDYGVPDT